MADTRHYRKEEGRDLGGGYTLIYSGTEEKGKRREVAVIAGAKISPYIREVKLIYERLIRCTLRVKGRKYIIYQVYALQQGCTEEEKEHFQNILEDECNITSDDTGLLIGNFKARVRKARDGIENIIGPFG